jgi:hypothetical protein
MATVGICGDRCLYCPRYTASKDGSIRELEKVKALWVHLGLRDPDCPVKEMACGGCKPENRCAYEELRHCVNEKELKNCGWCDAYPCELINQVFEKSDQLKAHADRVCTPAEMDILNKAFFSKRKYFDRIYKRRQKKSQQDPTPGESS